MGDLAAGARAGQRRAVVRTVGAGGPRGCAFEARAAAPPPPGRGELGLRVLAAGIANADAMMTRGEYPFGPAAPYVPGYDVAAVVEAVGPGVSGFAVGDRVVALCVWGGCQERLNFSASRVVCKVPDGCRAPPEKLAALVLNYLTAYQMLHRVAGLRRGQSCLFHGLAGGVGTAMMDLGRAAGVRVLGTCSGPKHGFVRQLGGEPLEYRDGADWERETLDKTDGRGVDAVFDAVAGEYVAKSLRCLVRRGGTYVIYGVNSTSPRNGGASLRASLRTWGTFALGAVAGLVTGRRAAFYGIQYLPRRCAKHLKPDLERLLGMLAAGALDPALHARAYALEDARQALQDLEDNATRGKVVVSVARRGPPAEGRPA